MLLLFGLLFEEWFCWKKKKKVFLGGNLTGNSSLGIYKIHSKYCLNYTVDAKVKEMAGCLYSLIPEVWSRKLDKKLVQIHTFSPNCM